MVMKTAVVLVGLFGLLFFFSGAILFLHPVDTEQPNTRKQFHGNHVLFLDFSEDYAKRKVEKIAVSRV